MSLTKVNPKARIFAKALVAEFPQFRKNLTVKKDGEFEAFLWSPPRSNAGALVCQSFMGDVWVRFAAGLTGCCCESVPDLLKTVHGILAGEVAITVVLKGKKWVNTFLHPTERKPKKKAGHTSTTYSWSSLEKRRPRVEAKAKR